jgi:sugar phosphate isomerase/epimerase
MYAGGVLGPNDLILSSGVVGNPPLPELIDAAHAGGYRGLALWPGAYHSRFSTGPAAASLTEVSRCISGSGLVVWDVDAAVIWAGPDDPGAPYYEEAPEPAVFDFAEAAGAHGVNLLLLSGHGASRDALTAEFVAFCGRAAERGLRVHLEFSRDRPPRDLASAAALVDAAGCENGGLMIDLWHLYWSGGRLEDLSSVRGEAVRGVQLCDVPAEEPADFAHATRYQRLAPGRGVGAPSPLLAQLRAAGCSAPLTLEAFDQARLDEIGARAFAAELAEAARAVTQSETEDSSRSRMGPTNSG